MPCLFACDRHCAVHVRGPGKVGYVLGDFTPDEEAARAILDYAARHAESEEGVVRYADRPRGVKGHFGSEEHTSELQSLMRISNAVFCLKQKKRQLLAERNTP